MTTALMVIPKPRTPGEWRTNGRGDVIAIDVPREQSRLHAVDLSWQAIHPEQPFDSLFDSYGGELVCESTATEADAMLIAAAPRLLAALEKVMPWVECLLADHHQDHKQAVTAILLARGGFYQRTSNDGDAEQNIRDLVHYYDHPEERMIG